jgi:hypothetical protein
MVLTETWLKGAERLTTLQLPDVQRKKLERLGYASAGTEEIEDASTISGGLPDVIMIPTEPTKEDIERWQKAVDYHANLNIAPDYIRPYLRPPKTKEIPVPVAPPTPEEILQPTTAPPTPPTPPTEKPAGFDFVKFISNNWLWLLLLLLIIAAAILIYMED